MAEHMSEVLGIPVNTFRATDYNAAVEALRTGNAQLAIVCGWVYDVMEGIFYEGVGGENGFGMEYTEGKCRKEDPFKAVGFRGGCCRSCRKRVYRKSGPDGDEKYFVCAYGSEEVYRICKKYFPGKVRENMQPVIERADKKDKQMVMELLMEAGLCGEMGSGLSFLDNLKRRWEA